MPPDTFFKFSVLRLKIVALSFQIAEKLYKSIKIPESTDPPINHTGVLGFCAF